MNARIGTSTHELLHNFELANQRFVKLGIEPHQSQRFAMALTLTLTGSYETREQVWEVVNEILPQRTTGAVTEPEQAQ